MDISIIVPLYKGKKYIRHIVDMIKENRKILIENRINKELEIIFINDFPVEKINEIDLCHSKDILLKLYKNECNMGIHGSRVKGLSVANGQYIVFLDQDDEISPYFLKRQLQYIGEADAVLCNGFYRVNKRIYKNRDQQRKAVCKDNYISKLNSIISPGQVMIKKTAIPLKWISLKFKKNGSDDVVLWILMLSEKKSFAINPFDDYKHIEDGKNTSLDFVNMRESVKEMLSMVKTENILENNLDLLLFEKASLERIRKYELYIRVIENWEIIISQIIELCRPKKSIAVYGYGVIGKKLLSDLKSNGIKVDFVIDKATASYVSADYKVYEPEKIPNKVDLIIITPLFAEMQIKSQLKEYKTEFLSLLEVL